MVKLSERDFHARYVERGRFEAGSDRAFALVSAGVFALVGFAPVVLSNGPPNPWAVGIAGVFLGLGVIVPSVVHPLNVFWKRSWALLSMILSPLLLGGLFLLIVTPVAVFLRLRGRDLLQLKLDKSAPSYWMNREPS